MTITDIARICHEANRAYCIAIGDESQLHWDDAKDWQKESAIRGVEFALSNPDVTPEQQHEAWCRDKIASGWCWGDKKDTNAKTHPCLVPYIELPRNQQYKDLLFRNIVVAMDELAVSVAGDSLKLGKVAK